MTCQCAQGKTSKTPAKTAGTVVIENKDHVLGVERKVCAALQSQDGMIPLMGVTERLGEVVFTRVP